MAARCSSTRSASCRSTPRPSSCARCRSGEIEPVGAARAERVNVRVISATNRRLLSLAQTGEFREDLYYRLNVFPIYLPPLRERPDDIEPLAAHFVARFAAEAGKRIAGLSGPALELLARLRLARQHPPARKRPLPRHRRSPTAATSRSPISRRSSPRPAAATNAASSTDGLPLAFSPRSHRRR